MTNDLLHQPSSPARSLGTATRRAVSVSTEQLVKFSTLPGGALPSIVEPAGPQLNLAAWAAANRRTIEERLRQDGGLLFRGFDLQGAGDLESFIRAVAGDALEYRERSSPRTAVKGNIYTSTDYPPDHPIFLHNENSYQQEFPLTIFFFCRQPAAVGGETPIADCRKVLARIDPEVVERFARRKWMYVRNFGQGFGLAWETVFQTSDRQAVERHCREKGIEARWMQDGRLQTKAVRSALARHPRTGEIVWFNHATFFHVSSLEPSVREALLEEFADGDLPANTYYGDGGPIEPDVMEHLRDAYRRELVTFPWRQGDLLMLDNMLVAHARSPYGGEREILVGMAEPVTAGEVQP